MNVLVKLSQNKKLMIPLVVVLGISIFGGSYVIQERRDTTPQGADTTETAPQPQPVDLQPAEPVEPVPEPPTDDGVDPDTPVSSDDTTADDGTIAVEVTVEGRTVTARLATDKPGECTLYAKNKNALAASRTIATDGSSCTFTNVDASGATTVQVQYHSTDQTAKGSGEAKL